MSGASCVCVVDDDVAIRETLYGLLAEAGYRVHTFASAADFLLNCDRGQCDCAIIDVRMPETNGLALQRQCQQQGWLFPCIFLSGHGDIPIAVQALQQGAVTFLEKPCDPLALLDAISQALATSQIRAIRSQAATRFEALLQRLTVEELAVLRGVIRGLSNRQIATTLDVSLRTVQFRLASLIRKSGVKARGELLELAWDTAGIPLSDDAISAH